MACLGIAVETFCALVLSGCVGATRLPSRAHDPTGATIQEKDIDLAFLQAGTTRREEVVNKLSQIGTGYSNSRLFWGRWSESEWGHWAFIPLPGGIAGGAERTWHVHNLLISFDENGVMQTKELIDDQKVLERELRAQLAKAPPLVLPQSVPTTVTPYVGSGCGYPGSLTDMTLTEEGMQIKCDDAKSPVVEISPLKVARISHERFWDDKSRSGSICHSLHLTEKTHIGKRIVFCTSADNLATLFKYFQQAGPPNMRWE